MATEWPYRDIYSTNYVACNDDRFVETSVTVTVDIWDKLTREEIKQMAIETIKSQPFF